jgi:Porphyromonas-type peptidyl-arginine deiminase
VKLSDFIDDPIRAWNGARWSGGKKNKPIDTDDWFFLGLLDVGGNYMVTGTGILASSYLVATQNEVPVSHEKEITNPDQRELDNRMTYILEQMNRFMGMHTYHVLADPTGTYIGHIDCWGKFLVDDKVLIARSEDKTTDNHFDTISDSFAAEGFTVYRVMCQNLYVPSTTPPATTAAYTNSLILNDHVYVPLCGKGHEHNDTKALAVYADALPDHTITGIIGKTEFPWLGTDAMHCRTRGIPRQVVDNWLAAQLEG